MAKPAVGTTIPKLRKASKVTGHAKRRKCNNKTTELMNRQANALAKSKELQPIAQADTVAAHLLLPQRTTTLLLTPLI